MRSLVAWASTHLAARDQSFEHAALRHRGSALNSVKSSIEDGELSPEMCLAVSMVFCSMESISSCDAWYIHLLGGVAALGCNQNSTSQSITSQWENSTSSVRLSHIEGGWLLCNFAYHDVLMSVTLDRPPLLSGQYWAIDDTSRRADPYFGYASDIIYLISQTSELRSKFAASAYPEFTSNQPVARPLASVSKGSNSLFFYFSPQKVEIGDNIIEGYRIEAALLHWSCPDESIGTPLHMLAEAYRSAALLHLYRTLRRYNNELSQDLDPKIRHHVSYVCTLVGRMPEGCLAECTLLFPLFMAGGETDDASEIEIIRDKMAIINKWRHFENVDHALRVLDELWRLRSAGAMGSDNRKIDWLDITATQGIKLALT